MIKKQQAESAGSSGVYNFIIICQSLFESQNYKCLSTARTTTPPGHLASRFQKKNSLIFPAGASRSVKRFEIITSPVKFMSAGGAATVEFLLELCVAISESNQRFHEPF